MGPSLMSLDPPYRLASDAMAYRFIGWTEIDPRDPEIRLSLNGINAGVTLKHRPDVIAQFPDRAMQGFFCQVDFRELFGSYAAAEVSEPFLLEATLSSGNRHRTFEYAVTEEWLQSVFGRRIRARRIPPEHLQVRVTGSAVGEFHRTGVMVANRIADLLREHNRPLQTYSTILDFGSGPGRVLDAIRDIHPHASLYGADIDPEAIGWAMSELKEVGSFQVVDHEPPLNFAEESLDLVVCISVFTHLPEDLQVRWLSELKRVLKPGGIVLTTKLDPDNGFVPGDIRHIGLSGGFVYWREAQATTGLPDFYRLAYHTDDYVRHVWGRDFDVVHIGKQDLNGAQDSVILRRPEAR